MNRAPATTSPRLLHLLAAFAATSLLLFLGTGLRPVWWLTWVAPLPLLLVASRVTRRRAFWMSALAWFLASANMWRYFVSALGLPVGVVLLVSGIPALLFGACVLLFRRLVVRGELFRATLSFPALWVGAEYLNSVTSRHGTFSSVAYTQMEFLPLLQIASATGIWGIGFLVFLLPATIAALLVARGTSSQKWRLAAATAASLGLAIGYGAWRLVATPEPEHLVRIGLTATGVDTSFPREDAEALRLLREYADRATALAAQGAEVVVLPEKIALVSDEGTREADALYGATAAAAKAAVVVGVDRGSVARRSNEARLYSPGGSLAAVYAKHHLVPGYEDADQPGTAIVTIDRPTGVWGVQICKDMDFPALSRRYAARRVGLLLVPAWDFAVDGWLHGRMAVMRGVESGFTVARAAKQGLLTISDDRGRVVAEQDATTARIASLVRTAPVRHDHTLYAQCGDWFAWLDLGMLMAMLACGLRSKDTRTKTTSA